MRTHLARPGTSDPLCETRRIRHWLLTTDDLAEVDCRLCLGMDVTGRNKAWYDALVLAEMTDEEIEAETHRQLLANSTPRPPGPPKRVRRP